MITVIDSIMGSGKTTCMIDYINRSHSEAVTLSRNCESHEMPKFIYIAPLLTEVDRITDSCPKLSFCDPEPRHGRKLWHLGQLIDEGANICTTHALFKLLTKEMFQRIKQQNYTLVIDETLECVTKFDDLSPPDRKLLIRDKSLYVEEGTKRLRWNHESQRRYWGKFDSIKRLCDNGNLVLVRDTVLIWKFPCDFLTSFEDVFVLTYLFEGSPMSSYLKAEGVDYTLRTLKDGCIVSFHDDEEQRGRKAEARGLITVYEGALNAVGKRTGKSHPFSKSWLEARAAKELSGIKSTCEYFVKSIAKTPSADNGWTTFKAYKTALSGAGYARGFIPSNAKATNDFKHKQTLVYLCNRFPDTYVDGYFKGYGIQMDRDAFALSEMVQWIWRSQIREGKPITVFIPSERMRGLLIDWLNEGVEDSAELAMAA